MTDKQFQSPRAGAHAPENILDKKIQRALRLIKSAAHNRCVEVSYSGGKDSDVILTLAKMAGIQYRAIYKNTTIDPPGTIAHCQHNSVEIIEPNLSFLELVKRNGMPTRRARFCCDKLKEYKVMDIAIQGIRRSESVKRAARYKAENPVVCRFYGSKSKHVDVVLPLLTWTDKDISNFIEKYHVQCHPLYYTDGVFHVERRLGCIGCPLQSDNGVSDFLQYPRFFRQYVKAAEVWWDTHPTAKSHTKFGSIYGLIAHNLFYSSYNAWQIADTNLFGNMDWKQTLEKYFRVTL